ncbi:hypothetical protein A3J90_07990 [candidate division WOR-1 bacterium RIFOXYC2_FULL_37_10]|uniref:Uncharacterized protein n=1 Tax=candidate division WOR-1 bacterium RIFOXYB2_FULL_37_13 TaxID=1802579 RepID=A0A1F4SF90_UNCSA|nr:MAG: hypothetical protein A2310_05195 [candidate division WOR-1 bacterium RIFOXYB2_FULL_37_13]OGC37330.1 MAG: hypothetical protein A3J90_07990 [candidate division WOR-1 bacterium RIFOXYC2_FULL_37_10]
MSYLERVRAGWENAFRDIRVRVRTGFRKDYDYDYDNVAKKRRLVAGALKTLHFATRSTQNLPLL